MQPIIPDTLHGALILSLIDFIGSFFIIAAIGVVLAGFPLIGRIAARFEKREPAAAPAPAAAPVEAPQDDGELVAVLAAAAHATLGRPVRIVRIEPSHVGEAWAAEGRLAHHGSHQPGRSRS
ncbi:MAG: OadG family transporter subunit [Rubrivivax sp.]